jgi:hypothetical protein
LNVLVSSAGEVDNQDVILPHPRCDFLRLSQDMGARQRRDDAFDPGEKVKGFEGLFIGNRGVFSPSAFLIKGMFRPNSRVI